MARPTESYAKAVQHGCTYRVDQRSPDGKDDPRYVSFMGWDFYESGRIESNSKFNRRPYERSQAAKLMQVEIAPANALPPFITPDGMKVPKAWLRSNAVYLWDKEYNMVFRCHHWYDGKIVYPHPNAAPYIFSDRPDDRVNITVYKPNRVKTNRLMKDATLRSTWAVARTAFRMENRRGGGGASSLLASKWINSPTEYAQAPESIITALEWRSEAQLREWVADACTDRLRFDYLRTY